MTRFLILLILAPILSCDMPSSNDSNQIVIAHRGASGYLPEHTLAAKAMAYAMDVDFIEQDLVLSKDNIPVVIHDIHLEEVTDVATKFPEMSRDDGRYYVIDFTFDQLTTLAVHERVNHKTGIVVFPDRFPKSKSDFRLHSLQQEIEMIQGLNKSTGKQIGVYPEIKNPGFHKKEGKDISIIVLQTLKDYGYTDKSDSCILQCFDALELKRIREELGSDLFLTQLMEFPEGDEKLETYASYADAIGPSIEQLLLTTKGNNKGNKIVDKAHQLNLKVHAYTFRKDEHPGFTSFEELLEFGYHQINLDGVFTDFPDVVVEFLKK